MTNANSVPVIKQTATVEGDVTDIVFKPNRNGKEFVTVSIQKQGLEFPINVRSTDVEIIKRMQNAKGHMAAGREVWLEVEVTESPTPNGNGVFRDVTRILRASLDGTPQEPDIEDSRPAPAKAQTARPPSVDENQMRIMRQSTLGYGATTTASKEKDFATLEDMIIGTINAGKVYLSYVLTGEEPSFDNAPEQPIEAPEPDVDLPVDPLDGEAPPLSDLDEPAPEVFEV